MQQKLEYENKYNPKLIKFHQIWGNTLYDIEDLVLDYKQVATSTYSQFRKKTNGTHIKQFYPKLQKGEFTNLKNEQLWNIHYRKPGAVIDDIKDIYEYYNIQKDSIYQDHMASMIFFGGETQALIRVNEYINEVNGLDIYFKTRQQFKGRNFSSKFSPYLSSGVLSARYIYCLVKEYSKNQDKPCDSKIFIDHIIIRDYYRYQIEIYKDNLFELNGLMDKEFQIKEQDLQIYKRWKTGTTGIPIIDACMRELVKTGYLSNKSRQMIATFLSIDIGYDWRYGYTFTRTHFIDHDPYINYGSWNNLSGLGSQKVNVLSLNEIKSNRVQNGYNCNQIYQSYKHDKNGDYIKQWVPELRSFPVEYIHEPWIIPTIYLQEINFRFNIDYNQPIYIEKYIQFQQKGQNDKIDYEDKIYQKNKARLKW